MKLIDAISSPELDTIMLKFSQEEPGTFGTLTATAFNDLDKDNTIEDAQATLGAHLTRAAAIGYLVAQKTT